jgi:hypothetical protein
MSPGIMVRGYAGMCTNWNPLRIPNDDEHKLFRLNCVPFSVGPFPLWQPETFVARAQAEPRLAPCQFDFFSQVFDRWKFKMLSIAILTVLSINCLKSQKHGQESPTVVINLMVSADRPKERSNSIQKSHF